MENVKKCSGCVGAEKGTECIPPNVCELYPTGERLTEAEALESANEDFMLDELHNWIERGIAE